MRKKSKYDMPAVQNFAFGGIANPSQRPFLRGSDKTYLNERQKELDAFEEQRMAYNTALQDWQTNVYNPYTEQVSAYNTAAEKYNTDVYNPYKSQVEAYNTAAQQYTTDVYNPYKTQYDEYVKAVEAYNAGDRTTDYTGPNEPTIASTFDLAAPKEITSFDMTAPTAPKDFSMAAPSLPFKEEDIVKYQQEAGDRARRDAGGRAVAIDVVSNPDQFNFGSMSVSNRFMARGGPVMRDMEPADDEDYYAEQQREERFSPVTTPVRTAAQDLTALTTPAAPPPNPTATAAEQVLDLRFQPKYRLAMEQELDASPSEEYDRAILSNYARATAAATPVTTPTVTAPTVTTPAVTTPTNTAAQQLTNLNNASTNTIASVPVSQATSQITVGQPTGTSLPKITNNNAALVAPPSNTLTAAIARDLMQRSMTTGVPTAEFNRYGGYAAVKQLYEQGGGTYTGNEISPADKKKYATQIATTGVGNLSLLGETKTQLTQTGIDNMRRNGIDEATIANAIKTYGVQGVKTITPLTTTFPATVLSSVMPSANWNLTPSTYRGATATGVSGYSGPIPTDFKSIFSATPVGWDGTSLTPKKPDGSSPPGGGGLTPSETTPITASSVPMFDYTSRGVGSAINNISVPTFNIGQAKEYVKATNPSNYFNIAKPGAPGISSGTTALGPADMPVPSALTTLGTIGANKNLTPTMLGGMENAGYRVDRLGNRIYAPAAKPLYGFAKGGDVNMADIMAMNTETLSDEKPEEVILTNPVGTAQKFLADLSSAGKASPTRQSVKRTKTSAGGGATAEKAMQMAYEDIAKGDLGAMKDRPPAMKNTESARAQMEELARVYQMKIRSAQNAARGLSADTFGAPTLEQPTLTKGKLTKKRFAEGGEAKKPEGELSQEEIDAASRPAFVTSSSGKGRKEGNISKQLKSGDAYINMAKGVTELPYDIAGAPMDIAMLVRQGLTGQAPAGQVGTSDYIKSKMTELGIRPAPPADPTAKGFYTAGSLLANLTNPAGVTRSAVKGAQKTAEAATDVAKDFQEYNRQLTVPGASYAVRPTGSTVMTGPIGMKEDVSKLDQVLKSGMTNAKAAAGQNEGQALIMQDFCDKKARNYFTRQFGTPDDPIARGISNKQIKGTALEEDFPEYLIDQISAGKTRVKEGTRPEGFVGPGTPESRFFPKYPRAMEDFTSRYDKATGIRGGLITLDPKAANPNYSNLLSDEGKLEGLVAEYKEQDKLLAQGVRPELMNTAVGTVTRSATDKSKVIGDGPDSAKALLEAYEEAKQFGKLDEPQKTSFINQLFGEGRKIMGKNEAEVGKNLLPENVRTAIDKGEPIYDVDFMREPLTNLFDPVSINKYLASIPPREAANIRFEDAVKGGLKMKEKTAEMENAISRIKANKPVADTVFSQGVSAPLLQFDEGPFKGFAWKRIEKREATMPEGAYVGHSVGGYETGGIGYTKEKMEGFNTGKYQVYTLRDNRNRPVNTIEVTMMDEFTPVVTQIKGNGRATGNTAPEKYDSAVLKFLQDYLRPAAVKEKDELLTPLLKTYKEGVNSTFKMP